MQILRIGVVGIGDISDVYLNNLRSYGDVVEVIGCAGRDLARARRKAEQHALRKAYATVDELIADPAVDVVLDLTTPEAHGPINLAALRAGKHVYTEKPLAVTFDESRTIIELATATGRYVGCAPDTFMGARLQTCRALIDDGRLGDIVGASAFVVSHGHEWFHPNPDYFYKRGAGPLLDIGPYYITALLSLLGPVTHCFALSRRTFSRRVIESEPRRGQTIDVEVDTHVTGLLEFASGAVVTLIASFDVWDSELPRMEIYGTQGTICLKDVDPLDGPNLFGGDLLFRNVDNYRWNGLPRTQPSSGWTVIPTQRPFASTSHRDNSRGIGLVDMAYAITQGRRERASGEMALHSIEVMEGLLRSAQTRQVYRLTTTCERPAALPVDFPASERVTSSNVAGG